MNSKAITYVLWLPPDRVSVGDSGTMSLDPKKIQSEIIMYTHQSVNIYYYKYTVDGMNIILVSILLKKFIEKKKKCNFQCISTCKMQEYESW